MNPKAKWRFSTNFCLCEKKKKGMALLKKRNTKGINVLSKCSLKMEAGSDVPRLRSWPHQNCLTMSRTAEKA